MKKILTVLACLLMAGSTVLTGCKPLTTNGGTSPESSVSAVSSHADATRAESEAPSSSKAAADSDADGDADPILQAIVEESKGTFETMKSGMEDALGNKMEMKMEARGSSLIYIYQFTEQVSASEAEKAEMEKYAEAMKEVFNLLLKSIKDAGVKDPSIVLEYWNHDGSMMFTTKYQ